MRILLVLHQNPDGYPAGIEQYMLDLISGLSLRGVDIFLFFPEKTSLKLRHYRMHEYEETIYKGGFTDFTSLEDANTESVFDGILSEVKPDIVHFHSLRWLPLSLVKLTKDRGRKVVISLHEYFLWCIHFILLTPEFCGFERDERRCYECLRSQDYKIDEAFILRRRSYVNDFFGVVDAVVSPSRYVKEKFSELYPDFDRAKCEIIELGIRKENFGQEPLLKNNPGGPLRIGFLGNFLYHKGSKTLLRLLEEFKNEKNFEFVIFGNIYDPIMTDYTNLNKYGHYSRTLIGQILKAEKIDVNLLLSIVPETFSYTLTESIASGVPVIAHDIGALRERVSGNCAGFLVPYENSVPHICSILKDAFMHREILGFFGNKCRENFQNILDIDDMISAHDRFYKRLLG